MQTLLDASEVDDPSLVKAVAGFPGGIGNTGGECGGVTAPIVLMGVRQARDPFYRGLPAVIYRAHELLAGFYSCNGTCLCRAIRGDARLPLKCVRAVRGAPDLYLQTAARDCAAAIPEPRREAYSLLYAHWVQERFHCAHGVLLHLQQVIPFNDQLLAGASGFIGGTAFTGMTCGAFTAGVMALGVGLGEIEDSRLRVLRMIARMVFGADAFADDVNAFNRVMNLGHRLSEWFTAAFGSTECRAITRCDFTTTSGVQRYIEEGGVARCRVIAERVALEVKDMIGRSSADGSRACHHVDGTTDWKWEQRQ